jgi:hypothetical protein
LSVRYEALHIARVKTPENQMWYFYKGFLRIYKATFKSFSLSIPFFTEKTYLVGRLEVLVGVAGVVAVLVGCCSLSAVLFLIYPIDPMADAAQSIDGV